MPEDQMKRKKVLRLLRLKQAGGTDKELTILSEIMNLEDDFQAKIDQVTQDFKDSVKDIKDNVPSLESLISSIKGFTGPKGDIGESIIGPPGETIIGEQGIRGSMFIGTFGKSSELPDANDYQSGDFAVVDGVIWYIV